MEGRLKTFLFFFLCLSLKPLIGNEILDLAGYVEQVTLKNEGFIASEILQQSYAEQSREGGILFAPKLMSQIEAQWTQSPQFIPYFPIFLNNSTLINQTYSLGLEQETPIGLDWKLEAASYLFELQASTQGLPPLLTQILADASFLSGPIPNQFTDTTWNTVEGLTVTQHLWKNGFGEKTRAQAREIKHNALAQSYQEKFKLNQGEMQAESVYWQLVVARTLTEIRKETLEQSRNLLSYIEKKKEESLVLESEVYQAFSILNSSQLEYQRAEERETGVSLTFNGLRGVSSPSVPEILVPLSFDLIDAMTPQCRGERNDLKAFREQVEGLKAHNLIAIHDLLPQLDISGAVGLQGNSKHFGQSVDLSFTNPSLTAGVVLKFQVPLFPNVGTIKRSYRNSSNSANLNYERMHFEQTQGWDRLMTQLKENKDLLIFLLENTEMQREKYENAKLEYSRGLNTVFGVTDALNDYQLAKITTLQVFQTIIEILLNLSLYETD